MAGMAGEGHLAELMRGVRGGMQEGRATMNRARGVRGGGGVTKGRACTLALSRTVMPC